MRCRIVAGAVSVLLSATLCAQASAANTYHVGGAQTYTTVNAMLAAVTLAPGDLVLVDSGTYKEVVRWKQAGTLASPITIRGAGASRPVFDGTGSTVDGALPNPRAIFQVEASNVVIENFEFINAANGNNGAGIRVTSTSGTTLNTVIRNCKITYCDMGMQCDSNDNLLVESSEVAFNGTSLFAGYSHNFYLNGNKTTIRYCYIHDSLWGQNFKTRGHYTELLYNTIADSQDGEIGLVDSAGNTDTANSNAVMIGNIVTCKLRGASWNHTRFIQFGQDGGGAHTGTLYAFNNTFYTADNRINFISVNATGAAGVFSNNIFLGSDILLQSGSNAITGAKNWIPNTATAPAGVTGSVTGASPGLANLAGRDYHLTAASPCIDAGASSLAYSDGSGASQSGLPATEYVNDLSSISRPTVGALDIGAYEYILPLAITAASLPQGTKGAVYSKTLSATGGVTPYTWTLNSGTLPTGMSLSASGTISGTPVNSGAFSFTAKVTDSRTAIATQSFSLTINPALSLPPITLPAGTVGSAYSQTLTLAGGTAPFVWSVSSGALPAGLALSAGVISGTATAASSATFSVTVTDAAGATATQNYSIAINAVSGPPVPLALPAATLPPGTVGVAYSQDLPFSGGTAPYAWSVSAGTLPSGLGLSSGKITGTPSAVYSGSFTVALTDALGASATQSYSLVIDAAIQLPPPPPPPTPPTIPSAPSFTPNPIVAGSSVTFSVAASAGDGGALAYAWTFGDGSTSTDAAPSHTYTTAGTFALQLTVTDSSGTSSTLNASIVVNSQSGGGCGGGGGAGGGAGYTTVPMTVAKLQASIKFNTTGHDAASLQGTLPGLPALFDPAGKQLVVNLNGVLATFTLAANGHGSSSSGSAALKFKPSKRNKMTKKNEFQGGNVAYSIRLQSGAWAALWNLDANASVAVAMDLPVTIQLGAVTYSATVHVSGKSKAKSGVKLKK